MLILVGCGQKNKEAVIEFDDSSWKCSSTTNVVSIKMGNSYSNINDEIQGINGVYSLTLTGLKEGKSIVSCKNNSGSIKEYNVEVDKNLNVTYK